MLWQKIHLDRLDLAISEAVFVSGKELELLAFS